tara:strand:- start:1768 stop:1968 length:201 start_codon:yes stop_codon:yes gene_type:complete
VIELRRSLFVLILIAVVVLGFMRFRALKTGKEWESDWAMAMTVRDGLVTHWRVFFDMSLEANAING